MDPALLSNAQMMTAIDTHFVDETLTLIQACVGMRNIKSAREIQKLALAEVDDPRLRNAIPTAKNKTP